MFIMGYDRKDTDLAIVNLAKLAAILARNANRFWSLFWDAGFVDKKTAVGVTTYKLVGVMTRFDRSPDLLPKAIEKENVDTIDRSSVEPLLPCAPYFFSWPGTILSGTDWPEGSNRGCGF